MSAWTTDPSRDALCAEVLDLLRRDKRVDVLFAEYGSDEGLLNVTAPTVWGWLFTDLAYHGFAPLIQPARPPSRERGIWSAKDAVTWGCWIDAGEGACVHTQGPGPGFAVAAVWLAIRTALLDGPGFRDVVVKELVRKWGNLG